MIKLKQIIVLVCFLFIFPIGILAEINWLDYGVVNTSATSDSNWKIFTGSPTTYFGTTDNPLTIKWDPAICPVECSPCTIGYEFEIFHIEQEKTIKFGILTVSQYELQLPKSGHYIIKVRTINTSLLPTDVNYASVWTISTDSTRTRLNGQANGWWIYGYVAKPGMIIFNF